MKVKVFLILVAICFFNCEKKDEGTEQINIENAPPSGVKNIIVEYYNNEVKVLWENSVDPEGDEIDYQITLYKGEEEIESQRTKETVHIYEALDKFERYRLEIVAFDNLENNSRASGKQIMYPNDTNPPSTVIIKDYILDDNSVAISWENSLDPEGYDVNYEVKLYLHPVFSQDRTLVETINTINLSQTFTIEQLKKYSIEIRAIDIFENKSEKVEVFFSILPSDTYEGDVYLRDQNDVDIFKNHSIKTVSGNVIILEPLLEYRTNRPITSPIIDLTPLKGIEVILGDVILDHFEYHQFEKLVGFEDLTTIQGVLKLNESKTLGVLSSSPPSLNIYSDLEGLSGLTNLGGLEMIENTSLGTINGLSNVLELDGDVILKDNAALTSFSALKNLKTIRGNIELNNNPLLTDLEGLNFINQLEGNLALRNNEALTTFSGFQNLSKIGGTIFIEDNSSLSTIYTLNNLKEIKGNIILKNNDALTTFSGFQNLLTIEGDLRIKDNALLEDINDINLVEQISGDCILVNNNKLTRFSALKNLSQVSGDFYIGSNESLVTIDALNNLSTINGELRIWDSIFANIPFFPNLSKIGGLELYNNTQLINIEGVNPTSLSSVQVSRNNLLVDLKFDSVMIDPNQEVLVTIVQNENLTSITGLSGFESFGSLQIMNNPKLKKLDGIKNISTVKNCLKIQNNDDLENLNFLSNLKTIDCGSFCSITDGSNITGNLVIKGNYRLTNFCGLTSFFVSQGLCSLDYVISQNGYNPTHQDIINGTCIN